ncbi:MAG: protein-methionine-sulfoxide reductase catalytic subunit MsrP [Gammaproteobacteria bacterium]|nr:protein-methionine-sulfoxide reductase catalytic subunit MsrP [Gammaproteobacteria bacterium]
MKIKNVPIKPSEITPEAVWLNRRKLIQGLGIASAGTALSSMALPAGWIEQKGFAAHETSLREEVTDEELVTTYNNFYEFGTDKEDPGKYAHEMNTDPWTISVEGLVAKPGKIGLEDLLSGIDIEERIYRLRCVEAWSAVIPWLGFPVKKVLDKFEPLGSAKYVAFSTHLNKSEMRGTRSFFSSIDFPYVEGLRLDEAYHDLAIFAIGMYGKELPNQNGAPIRLMVPWKYGFKSLKSIVRIELTDYEPPTTWNMSQPSEYGFYSNVNPNKDHPRWSQASERRLGAGFFGRRETLMFNGYSEVAGLYSDMDLMRQF